MLTIERVFGPEASNEIAEITLTPMEREIHCLMASVYADTLMPTLLAYNPLPAYYRKIRL